MANLAMDEAHSDGDVFYAGAVTDTDKLNGYSRAINNNTDYHLLHNQGSGGGVVKQIAKNTNEYLAGIAAPAAATWVVVNAGDAANLLRSTNSGVTWSNVAHNLGAACIGIISCAADSTRMICWSAATTAISADSGATWTVANTECPNCTAIYSMSYPTTTLAVAVGNASSLRDQWRCVFGTADQLDWAQAATGTTDICHAVHMLDGNDGVMVDVNENIWTTTSDAADTWSDTGDQTAATSDVNDYLYTISLTSVIISNAVNGLEKYNGTVATRTFLPKLTSYLPSNVVKTTAGYYYIIMYPSSGISDTAPIILCKSPDSGATWTTKVVDGMDSPLATTKIYGDSLVEYDTNKLLFSAGYAMFTIDESFTGAE